MSRYIIFDENKWGSIASGLTNGRKYKVHALPSGDSIIDDHFDWRGMEFWRGDILGHKDSLPENFFVRTPTEAIYNDVNERMAYLLGVDKFGVMFTRSEAAISYPLALGFDGVTGLVSGSVEYFQEVFCTEVSVSELFDSKYEPKSKDQTVTLKMTQGEYKQLCETIGEDRLNPYLEF